MGERAVDLSNAQQRLAELVAEAAARGEEVILTDGGNPWRESSPSPAVRAYSGVPAGSSA